MRAALLLAATVLAGYPTGLVGQDLRYSVVLGGGHTSWSGPFVKGGGWGLPLGAVLFQNSAEGQAVGSQRVRLACAVSFSADVAPIVQPTNRWT